MHKLLGRFAQTVVCVCADGCSRKCILWCLSEISLAAILNLRYDPLRIQLWKSNIFPLLLGHLALLVNTWLAAKKKRKHTAHTHSLTVSRLIWIVFQDIMLNSRGFTNNYKVWTPISRSLNQPFVFFLHLECDAKHFDELQFPCNSKKMRSCRYAFNLIAYFHEKNVLTFLPLYFRTLNWIRHEHKVPYLKLDATLRSIHLVYCDF